MKKSAVFILLVMFIVSVFLINFYGMSVRTDHMKQYVSSVNISHISLASDGTRYDYKWLGKEENKRKVVQIDISSMEMPMGLYVEYDIAPDDVDYETFEFAIDSDPGVVEIDGVETPRAVMNTSSGLMNRNLVMVYYECTFRVVLRTTDGSVLSDSINIWCLDLSAI